MDIIKSYAINNQCYKAAQKMVPKGIVVHSTGANNPYLKRYVDCPEKLGINQNNNHWNTPSPGGRYVCVHAFIGYDKDKNITIAEILPLNICCWGVGRGSKGSYNDSPAYIQFEICEDSLNDYTYYKNAFNIAAKYCSHLCTLYNIPINNVIGHCEAYKQGYGSNHSDPEHWMNKFGESMKDFRNKVVSMMKTDNATPVNTNSASSIKAGDLVSISDSATYYTGKDIPQWVKKQNWYVKFDPVVDRAVIDTNEKNTNSICSPINIKYLTVIKNKTDKSNTMFLPYKVKINTDSLNIRKGPGIDTKKVGCIKDNGVYTIIAEEKGLGASLWGKLKSGAGWIALNYTVKI